MKCHWHHVDDGSPRYVVTLLRLGRPNEPTYCCWLLTVSTLPTHARVVVVDDVVDVVVVAAVC